MRHNEYFADICNYLFFNGKQVIKPEQLQEKDSTHAVVVGDIAFDNNSAKNNVKHTTEPVQKYHDLLKSVQKEDSHLSYMMIGIENQDEIHLAMPVKNMHYDILHYEKQILEIKKQNDKEKKIKKISYSSKEFLSGLQAGQKLKPVVTIVVYWGKEQWTTPLTLKDLLDLDNIPIEILPYINDYRIPVIDVHHAKNLERFQTSVREVFQFLQHAQDKNGLLKLIQENRERFCLDRDAISVISYYTNINQNVKMYLEEKQTEGGMDMCQALMELIEDSKQEGKLEGIQEGKLEGIQEGKQETLLQSIINMMQALPLNLEQVMDILKIPEEERDFYRKKIQKQQ